MIEPENLRRNVSLLLGTRFRWGGTDPKGGLDGAGLARWVYARYGVDLPDSVWDQASVGAKVPLERLRAGDLLFFSRDREGKAPDQVGIYTGGGEFVYASSQSGKVVNARMDNDHYVGRFTTARRPVPSGEDFNQQATSKRQQAPRDEAVELAETYGLSWALINSDPELRKIFEEATDENWSADVFTAHLKNSKWWSKNSDTMRQALDLQKSDPATWKANLSAAKAGLAQAAVQLGAVLSDKALADMAKKVLTLGWNDAQIRDALGKYIKFNEDHVLGGQAGAAYQQIASFAYANGVRLTDEAIRNYAAYVARGVASMEEVIAQVRQQAVGAFPAYGEQIAAGENVEDILRPYQQVMAKELGIPSSAVTPFTPALKRAIGRTGQDGQPDPLSLEDFEVQVRQSPDWRKSQTAVSQTLGVGREVLKLFGLGN